MREWLSRQEAEVQWHPQDAGATRVARDFTEGVFIIAAAGAPAIARATGSRGATTEAMMAICPADGRPRRGGPRVGRRAGAGELEAWLSGHHPGDGSRLGGRLRTRNAGSNLTLTAPKSVSALAAALDPGVPAAVVAVHEVGVTAAADR